MPFIPLFLQTVITLIPPLKVDANTTTTVVIDPPDPAGE